MLKRVALYWYSLSTGPWVMKLIQMLPRRYWYSSEKDQLTLPILYNKKEEIGTLRRHSIIPMKETVSRPDLTTTTKDEIDRKKEMYKIRMITNKIQLYLDVIRVDCTGRQQYSIYIHAKHYLTSRPLALYQGILKWFFNIYLKNIVLLWLVLIFWYWFFDIDWLILID